MSELSQAQAHPVRVLHSVGHLLRGGIEKWLYQTLPPQVSRHCEHHIMVRTKDEEAFTSAFRQAGIPVLACANFLNPLRYARDFKRLVRDNGPYDILHVHGSSLSGLLTLALARSAGIRTTLVHSHNDVRPLLNSRGVVYRLYVAAVLRAYRALADVGFASSILAAESMFGNKWQRDNRWELFYNGVDCKPFNKPKDSGMRAQMGIPEKAFVIGHVGRFHEQKNHAFLIDVVQATISISPEVHCLLIGNGPLREDITEEIKQRGLQNYFTLVPDTTAVADYMTSAMDCFLFPSRYEGLGLVAIEAQAAGLPCVISDRVPAEAIVDASLVKVLSLERPLEEWAKTIIASRDPRREGHSAAAVSRVENSRFNLDHCIATLQLRYIQLAGREKIRDENVGRPAKIA